MTIPTLSQYKKRNANARFSLTGKHKYTFKLDLDEFGVLELSASKYKDSLAKARATMQFIKETRSAMDPEIDMVSINAAGSYIAQLNAAIKQLKEDKRNITVDRSKGGYETAKLAVRASGFGAIALWLIEFLPGGDAFGLWVYKHLYLILLPVFIICFCACSFIYQLTLAGPDPVKIAEVFAKQEICKAEDNAELGIGLLSGKIDLDNLNCNFKEFADKSTCDRVANPPDSCE